MDEDKKRWNSLTSPVDPILNKFLEGLGYQFVASQATSNEVWQEARDAIQALIDKEVAKVRIDELNSVAWMADGEDTPEKIILKIEGRLTQLEENQ